MARIGVFVCWCGANIASTVDVKRVAEESAKIPGVAHSVEYKYMCSDPGQSMIKEAIQEKKLTGIVVAACSPRMHEVTFRRAANEAGVNPYLLEMSNIREQCSWVHSEREEATEKAIDLVRLMVEKAKRNTPSMISECRLPNVAWSLEEVWPVSRQPWILLEVGRRLSWWRKNPPLAGTWLSSLRLFLPSIVPSAS